MKIKGHITNLQNVAKRKKSLRIFERYKIIPIIITIPILSLIIREGGRDSKHLIINKQIKQNIKKEN